ncbi:uncharacterized protein LOC110238831 [Exaiptasia diaphana]|uniref:BTB domain-containing protein n=1 Tax=Exaiptasia diaphana TaxID=2652724 RepID=A0A913X7P0_EXADI|nr:uncharacterized protein LOC110238831 [Exaiptasia diaphana]KXJ28532.1 BTB/POZ domain-containing protein KCTD6 [Exaiptasia diaphana]
MQRPSFTLLQPLADAANDRTVYSIFIDMMDEIVRLNVGGTVFQTSRNTLVFDANSRFYEMFSDDQTLENREEVFIDRDGTHFRYILNYLRTGLVTLPRDANALQELLIEAQYYDLKEIVDVLSKPCYQIKGILPHSFTQEAFHDSLILNSETRKYLHVFLGGQKVYNLLYRGSRDGWSADTFHCLCDNAGPTVTVIRKGSSVFGGFTQQSWSGSGSKTDPNAFLFSIVNPSGLGPVKLPLIEEDDEDTISCNPCQGPVFGNGRDLGVVDHPNRTNCITRLGNSFKCPAGQVPTLFLAGILTFTVSEIEVYGVNESPKLVSAV